MKRIISLLLAVVLLCAVLLQFAQYASAAGQYKAETVVSLANQHVNGEWPNGWCLAYIATIFNQSYGLDGNVYSSCCAYQNGNRFIDSISRVDIPLGACVYFGGSTVQCSCGSYAGHIGLYVGNNNIIHAWDGRIVCTSIDYVINCGYPYRGYGWYANQELQTVCSHSYNTVETPASCTNNGEKKYTCSACGDTYSEPINAPGHNYVGVKTDATCTTAGYTTYTCSRCGDSYVIEADGWSDWSTQYPAGIPENQIEKKTQYSTLEKEYTTSASATLEGWTNCGTTYDDWGAEQTTTMKPAESDILRITKTEQTGWGYYHYCNYYSNGGNNWNIDSIACGSPSYLHGYTSNFELPGISFQDQGGRQAYGGTGSGASPCAYNFYVWFRNTDTDVYTYSYQTRNNVNRFYRWADEWSDWTDNKVESNEDRKVKTQTVYRYYKADADKHIYDNACDVACNNCGATRNITHNYVAGICSVCGSNYVAPKVTTQPKSISTSVGSNAKFTVAVKGSGLKYQWQYRTSSSGSWQNSGHAGNKTATLTVAAKASNHGYQYRCKITDQYGNIVYTNDAKLTVKPAITTQPAAKTVSVGSNAKFTVAAKGSGLKYQWQYRTSSSGSWQNSGHAGNKTATLTVATKASNHGYQYRCKITDQYGNIVYTNDTKLTVKPAITTQPGAKTVSVGSNAKFTVAAKGSGLKYQWQYHTSSSGSWQNSGHAGNKTATLTVATKASNHGYQYRCKITDQYGNIVYTNDAKLTVKPAITAQPAAKTVSVGSNAKFTVAAKGSGLKYQWQYRTSTSGSWQNSGHAGNKTATLTVATKASNHGYQYRCKITDSYGNVVYTNAAKLTVKPAIITQPVSVTVSNGSTAKVAVKATGAGLKYQWYYTDNANDSTFSKSSITTAAYSVQMNKARAGRKVYCVITDKYGNTVTSNTVVLKKK